MTCTLNQSVYGTMAISMQNAVYMSLDSFCFVITKIHSMHILIIYFNKHNYSSLLWPIDWIAELIMMLQIVY